MRFCRVCGTPVTDPDKGWVELNYLGRFWICTAHRDAAQYVWHDHLGWIYWQLRSHQEPLKLILGPYPYDTHTRSIPTWPSLADTRVTEVATPPSRSKDQ